MRPSPTGKYFIAYRSEAAHFDYTASGTWQRPGGPEPLAAFPHSRGALLETALRTITPVLLPRVRVLPLPPDRPARDATLAYPNSDSPDPRKGDLIPLRVAKGHPSEGVADMPGRKAKTGGEDLASKTAEFFAAIGAAMNEAKPEELVTAYNSIQLPGLKPVKKFASRAAGIKKITETFEAETDKVRRAEMLGDIAEHLPVEIDRNLRQGVAELVGLEYAASGGNGKANGGKKPEDDSDSEHKEKPAPQTVPGAKKPPPAPQPPAAAANKDTPAGRTQTLLGVLEGGPASVDDLSKKLGWSHQNVRNAIDSARRSKHSIAAMGKGVFKLLK